jgi:hypothetical protein
MPSGVYIRTAEALVALRAGAEKRKGHPPYAITEEIREKMVNSHLGQKAWNKGLKTGHIPWNKGKHPPGVSRPVPLERRKRISATLKGRPVGAHIARNYLGGPVADAFYEVLGPAGYVREHMVFWGGKGEFYRLDFTHKEAKVNIELDGPTHFQGNVTPEGDRQRDQVLRELGWRIIRIKHGKDI